MTSVFVTGLAIGAGLFIGLWVFPMTTHAPPIAPMIIVPEWHSPCHGILNSTAQQFMKDCYAEEKRPA